MRRSKIALVTVIAAAVIGGGAYAVTQMSSTSDESPEAAETTGTRSPNPEGEPSRASTGSSAPTETATAAPAPQPDDGSPSAGSQPGPELAATDVMITYAAWSSDAGVIEVSAYANLVEEAGTCTVTATSKNASATASAEAVVDVSTMACGSLSLPRDRLSSGTWEVSVSYGSATSAGTSPSVEVVVP